MNKRLARERVSFYHHGRRCPAGLLVYGVQNGGIALQRFPLSIDFPVLQTLIAAFTARLCCFTKQVVQLQCSPCSDSPTHTKTLT